MGEVGSGTDGPALRSWYADYLAVCNRHEFDRLGEFVAQDVEVNDSPQGLDGYVAGLREVVRVFPDYRWDLRHLFVDHDRVSAHFSPTGTHSGPVLGIVGTGRRVTVQEFAVYRVVAGRIQQVWTAADNLDLLGQLR